MAERVTLCIVNYNGAPEVEDCLRAALRTTSPFAEILLVDNSSQDASLEIVRRRVPGARVLRLDRNRGPAAARNVGFRSATTDLVLFVDNDVCLAPDCPALLARALRANRRACAAMPSVLYAGDPGRLQYDGADAHFLGLVSLQHADAAWNGASRVPRAIGSVVSACLLVDRRAWPDQEPFDESFFIYLEDHDFALRARARGWEVLAVPAARCYHGEGTPGLSLRRPGGYSQRRVFFLIRNRWQVILKNYAWRSLLALSPLFAVYEAFQLAAVLKRGWLGAWLRAVVWLLTHLPAVLRKRRAVQRRRRVPDGALLHGGAIPFTDQLARSRLEAAGKRLLDGAATRYWRWAAGLLEGTSR